MMGKVKSEKVIFVFYTFEDKSKGGSWSYVLPKNWWFVGSGSTSSVSGKKLKYENEEQFQGPKTTQKNTIQYLDKFFKKLKSKGVITIYKIRQSYLP
jgi:hypothetical protein